MIELLTSVSYSSVLKLAILCLTFLAAVNMICASVRAIAATRLQAWLEASKHMVAAPSEDKPGVQPDKPWPRD